MSILYILFFLSMFFFLGGKFNLPLLTVSILRVLLFANYTDVRYWYFGNSSIESSIMCRCKVCYTLVSCPSRVVSCVDVRYLFIGFLSSKSRFMCRFKVPFYWFLVQQKSFHVPSYRCKVLVLVSYPLKVVRCAYLAM